MSEIQVGVISDIHGNCWALEAVLEDIERRSIEKIVNLGDSLYGPLAPAKTAEILLELDIPTVCGNEDRIIVEALSNKEEYSPTLAYVLAVTLGYEARGVFIAIAAAEASIAIVSILLFRRGKWKEQIV